jgi:hypothetical protein
MRKLRAAVKSAVMIDSLSARGGDAVMAHPGIPRHKGFSPR